MKYTKLTYTYRTPEEYAKTKIGLNRAVSNVVGAGGFPKSQHPRIHKNIRDRGFRCYIAQQWAEDGYDCHCGVGDPSDIAALLSEGWKVTVGYTHDHAAHKLGGSNATAGWAFYIRGY